MPAIERARRYFTRFPLAVSGQRGHDTTFRLACVLVHGFALNEKDALVLLQEWNRSCQPPWYEWDLVHKIKSASSAVHKSPRGWLLGRKFGERVATSTFPPLMPAAKPEFNAQTLKRVAQKTFEIQDVVSFISERSPVRVETQDSASVLRRLYARGSHERVLIFSQLESQGEFVWEADRSDVIQNEHLPGGNEGVWFLPQPITGDYHQNPRQHGKLSRRSQEAITVWRYVVLESDAADTDEWLRCLIQLPLRIASICDSARRSIHALVLVGAASKADWDARVGAVRPILITLGADPGALTAIRLSRLPQARRGDRFQRLLYLNPHPDGIPILYQPTWQERCSYPRSR